MKTPQILDLTIKVISIDGSKLLTGTKEQLKGYHTYKDTQIGEHLYGCMVKEDIEQITYLNAKVSSELDDIQELCNKNDASYFRIVNP